MSKQKTYEELTFTDDFMFCKILEQNPDLCKELIELILGKKIEIIKTPERQKPIEITPDGKGIRLDVRLEGSTTIYSLEMQNAHRAELPKRSRYYLSLSDLDQMDRGAKYSELKDNVLLFICTFDPFNCGRRVYTVKKIIEQEPEYNYNDGERTVFVSSLPNQQGDESEELIDFLRYVNGDPSESELAARFEKAISRAKTMESWRKEYMLLYEIKDEAHAEGFAEGREQGLTEGREEGREQGLTEARELNDREKRDSARKLKEGGVPLELIASSLNIPIEEI